MIDKIEIKNNISFKSRFYFNGYSKHIPKSKPYDEFYFMPELQKKNSVVNFFKNMYKIMKDIIIPTKSSNIKRTENVKNFSTIERNGTGMFFEA